MAALTKADMAEKLYEELGLNKREAKEIVDMFFEEIRWFLESVDLQFSLKYCCPSFRWSRNAASMG